MTSPRSSQQQYIYYTNENGPKTKGIHGGPKTQRGNRDKEQDLNRNSCEMTPQDKTPGDGEPKLA